MQITQRFTDLGFCATDGTVYSTLALLLAAGKTAFPGKESEGLNPRRLVLTSLAAGDAGPGSEFTFSTNEATVPTIGTVVEGSGQQFVVDGLDARTPLLIQNVCVVSMAAASDDISITAIY